MAEDAMGKVTAGGERLILAWIKAGETLGHAEDKVKVYAKELEDVTNKLGEWLTPGDAKIDETIGVWYGDSLISATKASDGVYLVRVRKRGRSLSGL